MKRKAAPTKRRKALPKAPRTFPTGDGRLIKSLGIIARGVGCSVSFLSMVLDGKRKPSFQLAAKWAAFVGMSMERLWLTLYGEQGIVPAGSPVALALAKEGMPRSLSRGSPQNPPPAGIAVTPAKSA